MSNPMHGSQNDFLGDRKHALEELFFAQQDAELTARLRHKKSSESHLAELRSVCAIKDEHLLKTLVDLDIQAGTYTALSLVPLVTVAWANNRVETGERRTILEAAAESGIAPGTDAHRLLDSWLATRPGQQLFEGWKEYVLAVVKALDPAIRGDFRDGILRRSRAVAEASGGLIDWLGGGVSPAEQRVLNEIEKTFEGQV